MARFNFETSAALRTLLADPFEQWRSKHGGDLKELAYRCGVSSAYLGHVRRYGRVPSTPVLILLAFNLRIDGQKIFDAAGIRDQFPYDAGLEITKPSTSSDNFFSFRFDAEGFSEVIRGIVRSELKQRSLKEVLGSRPLRVGVNYHMFWMLGSRIPPADERHRGAFVDLLEMLGLALQKEVEFVAVPFSQYMDGLASGHIDLFGPTMIVPHLPMRIPFTRPLFRLGASALWRKREHPDLAPLPIPKLEDLRDERYQMTLVRNSFLHLIANTRLGRPDSTLIFCASDEEALERLTLRAVARPAHVFLTNSMRAITSAKENPKELEVLFNKRKTLVDLVEVGIAVRPDWPEIPAILNEAIRFLFERGVVTERLEKVYTGDSREVVELISR